MLYSAAEYCVYSDFLSCKYNCADTTVWDVFYIYDTFKKRKELVAISSTSPTGV